MREGIEGTGFGNVPELIADVRDSAQVRIFACLLYDIFENDVGQVDTTGVELYAERELHSGVEFSMQARLPPPASDVNDAAVRAETSQFNENIKRLLTARLDHFAVHGRALAVATDVSC